MINRYEIVSFDELSNAHPEGFAPTKRAAIARARFVFSEHNAKRHVLVFDEANGGIAVHRINGFYGKAPKSRDIPCHQENE
jgi:hypothetical protein